MSIANQMSLGSCTLLSEHELLSAAGNGNPLQHPVLSGPLLPITQS